MFPINFSNIFQNDFDLPVVITSDILIKNSVFRNYFYSIVPISSQSYRINFIVQVVYVFYQCCRWLQLFDFRNSFTYEYCFVSENSIIVVCSYTTSSTIAPHHPVFKKFSEIVYQKPYILLLLHLLFIFLEAVHK